MVVNDRLKLYGPLSPPSSNEWDSVGSSNFSKVMANWPFGEALSQSSNVAQKVAQIAYVFQSSEELSQLRPSFWLPSGSEDYELVACDSSDWLTGIQGQVVSFCTRPFLLGWNSNSYSSSGASPDTSEWVGVHLMLSSFMSIA